MTEVQATDSATESIRPAPLWRRLAALLYDLIAVLAIVMVVGMICQIATSGHLIATGAHTVIAWWYQPLQLIVVLAYFVVSWLRGGQTLGMRPWRLRLHMADGSPVRASAALVRAVAAASPILLLALTPVTGPRIASLATLATWTVFFAVSLLDRRSRALHDIVAGTEVIAFTPGTAGKRQAARFESGVDRHA